MEGKKIQNNANSEEITLEGFAEKVKKMRHYQRRYLATRDNIIMQEAKKLEAEVDSIINDIFDKQMNLF
jgi:hypothetical protein